MTIEDAREVSEREDEGVQGRKGMGGRKAQRRGEAGKRAVPFLALTVRASSLSCAVGKSLYLPHAPGSSFRVNGFGVLSSCQFPLRQRPSGDPVAYKNSQIAPSSERGRFRVRGLGRFGVGVKSSRGCDNSKGCEIPKKGCDNSKEKSASA